MNGYVKAGLWLAAIGALTFVVVPLVIAGWAFHDLFSIARLPH